MSSEYQEKDTSWKQILLNRVQVPLTQCPQTGCAQYQEGSLELHESEINVTPQIVAEFFFADVTCVMNFLCSKGKITSLNRFSLDFQPLPYTIPAKVLTREAFYEAC